MTAVHCPPCYSPVEVAPHAREGRHERCRPQPIRRHSQPRVNSKWQQFMDDHNTRNVTQ